MDVVALASLALVAGFVSFTAPCTLPLLPGYVSFVSGMDAGAVGGSRRRVVAGSLLFVGGFSLVFVVLGLTASALGLLLAQQARLLNVVGGGFIALMGVLTMGLVRVPALQRTWRRDLSSMGTGPLAAFPLGAAFALGWTPCIGPVLAAVLATAASTATMTEGALLLAAYSLGLGVPFLGLAIAVSRGRGRLGWLRRNSRRIEVAGGVMLTVMGVAIMTGWWTTAMNSMLRVYARVGWPPF